MSEYRVGELFSLTTFDGESLVMEDDVRFLTYGFFGTPPINFHTVRGYKQHGSTEINYLFNDRRVSFRFWHAPSTPRQAYWDTRARLLDFLRPNRGGPLMLTVILPEGDRRSLIVRADPGLQFPPEPIERNNWNIEDDLEFIAFDPFWFDTDGTTLELDDTSGNNLVFPITFPIQFGTAGQQFSSGAFVYSGTWETFPVITLTGPYTSVTIEQVTLDVIIYLTVPIGVGEQRILTLTPGAVSLVDENGDSQFGDFGPGSNLVDFRIVPEPEAASGVNEIRVTMLGGTIGQSTVNIAYNNRYYGL